MPGHHEGPSTPACTVRWIHEDHTGLGSAAMAHRAQTRRLGTRVMSIGYCRCGGQGG
jgi:hypothetical protein